MTHDSMTLILSYPKHCQVAKDQIHNKIYEIVWLPI